MKKKTIPKLFYRSKSSKHTKKQKVYKNKTAIRYRKIIIITNATPLSKIVSMCLYELLLCMDDGKKLPFLVDET